MGTMYHAEVPLKIEIPLVSDLGIEYVLQVEGRADGIIADINYDEDGNKEPENDAIIDEIKTMQTDVSLLKEPVYVHKAQALVYGYIYASQKKLSKIGIQMTYVTPEPETINKFLEEYTFERIEEWFNKLITGFKRWTDYTFDERHKRTESIRELKFPYEYREGQKNLCVSVYRAIEDSENLYIQAPTGVGKTLSTVFPAVQALGQQMSDKIFYLTSKTITRTVAEDTYAILRDNGLHMRTVTLTAKDKICPLDERNCNPVACPYAKGHFDRINDAVYDIITSQMVIGRDMSWNMPTDIMSARLRCRLMFRTGVMELYVIIIMYLTRMRRLRGILAMVRRVIMCFLWMKHITLWTEQEKCTVQC